MTEQQFQILKLFHSWPFPSSAVSQCPLTQLWVNRVEGLLLTALNEGWEMIFSALSELKVMDILQFCKQYFQHCVAIPMTFFAKILSALYKLETQTLVYLHLESFCTKSMRKKATTLDTLTWSRSNSFGNLSDTQSQAMLLLSWTAVTTVVLVLDNTLQNTTARQSHSVTMMK